MRDRMERLVLLPFSIGCVSESSVAIALPPRTPPNNKNPLPNSDHESPIIRKREEDEESSSSTESMKNAFKFLAIPKPNISDRFHRLVRNIKTISQLFEYKDEMEEVEMEMEIGLPTDVKHVTHIGWDQSSTAASNNINNNNPIQGWDNLIPPELLSLHQPNSPFKQFHEIHSVPSSSHSAPATPPPSANLALTSTT